MTKQNSAGFELLTLNHSQDLKTSNVLLTHWNCKVLWSGMLPSLGMILLPHKQQLEPESSINQLMQSLKALTDYAGGLGPTLISKASWGNPT